MKILQAYILLCSLLIGGYAAAEVRTIAATGEYRMGDNDTRSDAKRLALLDAKRLALEQAGTYLESVTEVKNLQVGRDELRAYTAGIVEVIEQATQDVMEGATHVVRVEVSAKIDAAVVRGQIAAVRQNETAKAKLEKLGAERDQLRREVEAKSRELVLLKSKTEVERATKKRQEFLGRLEVMDAVQSGRAALRKAVVFRSRYREASYHAALIKSLKNQAEVHGAERVLSALRQGQEEDKEEFQKAMGKAREAAKQALALGSSALNPEAHSLMGNILLEEGDAISAVKEYRTALRLQEIYAMEVVQEFGTHPRLQELVAVERKIQAQKHFDLATALKAIGDLSAAVEEFRKAATLVPEEGLYHFSFGEALEQQGELANAVNEYRIARRLEPNMGALDQSVPRALAMLGEWDEAFREIRGSCRTGAHTLCVLGVDDVSLATSLANHLLNADNRAGAIAAAHYAVRLGPKTSSNHAILAGIFVLAGDLPGASREYRAALQLEPDSGHTHGKFAAVLAEMGDVDGATQEARNALQLEPANEEAHFALGKALLARGDKAAAAQELREFLKRVTSKLDTDALLKDPKISMETKLMVLEAVMPEKGVFFRDARQEIVGEILKMTEEAVRQNAVPEIRLVGDKELARISDAVTMLRNLSR